jgi:hypothetical protein
MRALKRVDYMLARHVHTSHVVQIAIIALSDSREQHVIDPNSRIFRCQILDQRIVDNPDAVRVSQRDG